MWLETVAETVKVRHHEKVGEDAFGAPITEPRDEDVPNVLVAPGARADLGEDRPEGTEINYTLYFPETYTGSLEGAEVQVRGQWLRIIGHPDAFRSDCPTSWNMVAEAGSTHG